MSFTNEQLINLKNAYARGVLKVREGDTWIEYQSMKEMRLAISEIEADLANSKPKGAKYFSVSKGY